MQVKQFWNPGSDLAVITAIVGKVELCMVIITKNIFTAEITGGIIPPHGVGLAIPQFYGKQAPSLLYGPPPDGIFLLAGYYQPEKELKCVL